jgi:ATP-dependent DNA helicase RecG
MRSFIKVATTNGRISAEGARVQVQNILKSLHLVDRNGKLKAAAVLFFGKDPTKYFPHAYLKIGLFGKDH